MDILLHADTQHRAVLRQNIQGDSRKFLGNFKRHFVPQISSESLKLGYIQRIKPIFATKVTLILTVIVLPTSALRKPCTVTQNLDLDQMSERSIRTLKDTNITHFLLQILGFLIFVT